MVVHPRHVDLRKCPTEKIIVGSANCGHPSVYPVGSILQIEPKYFGAISVIAPAGNVWICKSLTRDLTT